VWETAKLMSSFYRNTVISKNHVFLTTDTLLRRFMLYCEVFYLWESMKMLRCKADINDVFLVVDI